MKVILFPLLFLVALLPTVVFSGEVEEENMLWYYREKDPALELIDSRTPNTKVFLNEDGHVTYRVYLQPVHYFDKQGKLQDITDGRVPLRDSSVLDYRGYVDAFWEEIVLTDHIWTNEVYLWRGFARFNTSGIPDTVTVDSVELSLNCVNPGVPFSNSAHHDIWSMENNPQGMFPWPLYDDCGPPAGEQYVDDFVPWVTGWKSWVLGDDSTDYACRQMDSLLPYDWFAIGMSDWGAAFLSNSIGYDRAAGYIEIEEPPTAVNLVSFSATAEINCVHIEWRTEFEVDNLEWLLEKKQKHGEYELIAIIPGQLTKPGPTDYSYTDGEATSGEEYFYRLINVNTRGRQTVHNPIAIRIPVHQGERLLVSPTIFQNEVSILISGVYRKNGTLSIFDKTGRVIRESAVDGRVSPLNTGWDGRDGNGRKVNAGLYYIRLSINGSAAETKKVILIK